MLDGLFNIQKIYADMMDSNTVEDPYEKYTRQGLSSAGATVRAAQDNMRNRLGLFTPQQQFNQAVGKLDPNSPNFNQQMMSVAQKHDPKFVPQLAMAQQQLARDEEDRARQIKMDNINILNAQEQARREAMKFARLSDTWKRDDEKYAADARAKGMAATRLLVTEFGLKVEDVDKMSEVERAAQMDAFIELGEAQFTLYQRKREQHENELLDQDRRAVRAAIDQVPDLPEGADQNSVVALTHKMLKQAPNERTLASYMAALETYQKQQQELIIAAGRNRTRDVSAATVTQTTNAAMARLVSSGALDYVREGFWGGSNEKFSSITDVEDFIESNKDGEFNSRYASLSAEIRYSVETLLGAGYPAQQAIAMSLSAAAGIPVDGGVAPEPQEPTSNNDTGGLNADELLDKDLKDTWLQRWSRNGPSSFLGAVMFDAVGGPEGFSIPTRTQQNIQNMAARDQSVIDQRNAAISERERERLRARSAGQKERERQATYAALQRNVVPR